MMAMDFDKLKLIGDGNCSKVFLVRKRTDPNAGQLYAMKVISKLQVLIDKKKIEHIAAEREILEVARGSTPFIVTLHYAFQTKDKLYLILDYVSGGDLFTQIQRNTDRKFNEDQVRVYVGELILALEQLHKMDIIYRDLKPENILLDSEGHIVLTDFGISKKFLPHEEMRAYTQCGTPEFMAPEIAFGGFSGYSMAVDWWSVGVLTHELLTGTSPFLKENLNVSRYEICRRILTTHPTIPENLSENARDFISRLLIKDPRFRLGSGPRDAEALKAHPFFTQASPPFSWEALAMRQVPPPFVPNIKHELDTTNFPDDCTSMELVDSPDEAVYQAYKFQRYTYIAPPFRETVTTVTKDAATSSNESLVSCADVFHQSYSIDDYQLGEGAYSTCRRCVHKETGREYAVKIIRAHYDSSSEVNFLRVCQGHPNIVDLHEVHQDRFCNYIVMELLSGGELLSNPLESFTEQKTLSIIKQLASAIHYMHSRGVVHRDIKPENLVFAHSGNDAPIKIVDFGLAEYSGKALQTLTFTLPYAAPEVLEEKEYTESCDIWSLGAVMRSMLFGSYNREVEFDTEEAQSRISDLGRDVLKCLLATDPSKRLTASKLLEHSWLKAESDLTKIAEVSDDDGKTQQSSRKRESEVVTVFPSTSGSVEVQEDENINNPQVSKKKKAS